MFTLIELLKNMSHSTLIGVISVMGIFLFLIGLVGTGYFRVKEQMEEEE